MSSLPEEPFFPLSSPEFKAKTAPKRNGPFLIGVCGASASGKTSVCNKILDEFKYTNNVTIISLDSFYRELTKDELEQVHQGEYDFDHPNAFDWKLLCEVIRDLRTIPPKSVTIPIYDFCTHRRSKMTTSIYAVDIVLFEGILMFHDETIRNLFDMKVFVETDADTCLSRRIIRDIKTRGRDLEGILTQYERFVKPGFDLYVRPQKQYADIIIPRGSDNVVAISLLTNNIRVRLEESMQGTRKKKGRKYGKDILGHSAGICDRDLV